jgi:polysaccharide biosynthesis transport protein
VIDATQVQMVQGSNVLEITYSSSSPDVSRRAADAIRQAYVDQTVGFKRETAARNAQWFDRETERLKGELAVAEKKAAEFEKANGIILQDDTTDTETAKLRALAASSPVAPVSAGPAMPISVPSQAQVAAIDTQIAIAAEQLGPNHPNLVALRRQRATAEQGVQREMAVARASMGRGAGPSIESAINAQTQKVLEKRGLVGEAQRLAANVNILRGQYQKTASRAADLKQQAMSTESGLTLLGNAVAPEDPVSPNIPAIILGGLGAGLGLGLALSLAIELFRRRVRGVEDLAYEGVPVIGAMIKDAGVGVRRDIWYWLGFSHAPWKRAIQ